MISRNKKQNDKKGFNSISERLQKISLFTIITALLLVSIENYISSENKVMEDLFTLSGLSSEISVVPLTFQDEEALEASLEAFKKYLNLTSLCVYEAKGELFSSYSKNDMDTELCVNKPPPLGYKYFQGFADISHPILLDGEIIGDIYIRLDLKSV